MSHKKIFILYQPGMNIFLWRIPCDQSQIKNKHMKKTLTYEQAYEELSQIANEIQNESVSVDVLAQKVKRASELVAFCQNKLRATEMEVNNIIAQMEQRES